MGHRRDGPPRQPSRVRRPEPGRAVLSCLHVRVLIGLGGPGDSPTVGERWARHSCPLEWLHGMAAGRRGGAASGPFDCGTPTSRG